MSPISFFSPSSPLTAAPAASSEWFAALRRRPRTARVRSAQHRRGTAVGRGPAVEQALTAVRLLLATDDPLPREDEHIAAVRADLTGHVKALLREVDRQRERLRLSSEQQRLVERARDRSSPSVWGKDGTMAFISLVKLAETVQELAVLVQQSPRISRIPFRRPNRPR
ncbi:hypothetical protein [Streptomyces jumonjinensis]|uniref:hypothetical protein n=1 Tax=Streptomyces jumonjinensis TaxID=1945 RepID=UPI003799C2AF